MMDEDRDALCRILRLSAATIRAGVTAPSPLDIAMWKMREAGQRENATLRQWAIEAAAWANDGYAVGSQDGGYPAIACTFEIAADAVESGRWVPAPRSAR